MTSARHYCITKSFNIDIHHAFVGSVGRSQAKGQNVGETVGHCYSIMGNLFSKTNDEL